MMAIPTFDEFIASEEKSKQPSKVQEKPIKDSIPTFDEFMASEQNEAKIKPPQFQPVPMPRPEQPNGFVANYKRGATQFGQSFMAGATNTPAPVPQGMSQKINVGVGQKVGQVANRALGVLSLTGAPVTIANAAQDVSSAEEMAYDELSRKRPDLLAKVGGPINPENYNRQITPFGKTAKQIAGRQILSDPVLSAAISPQIRQQGSYGNAAKQPFKASKEMVAKGAFRAAPEAQRLYDPNIAVGRMAGIPEQKIQQFEEKHPIASIATGIATGLPFEIPAAVLGRTATQAVKGAKAAKQAEKGKQALGLVNEAYANAKVETKPQPKPKPKQAIPEVIPELKLRTQARKEVFEAFNGEIPMKEIKKLSEKQMADLLGKTIPPKASTTAKVDIPNVNVPKEQTKPITGASGAQTVPVEPPKVAKPKPEVMRNAFRGQNGMVRIEFPDAYHADMFDYASKIKRSMKGNNPLKLEPGYIERMRKYLANNLGIPEDQVFKVANEYSDSVRLNIKGLEEGTHYKAPDYNGKLKEVVPPVTPKATEQTIPVREQPKVTPSEAQSIPVAKKNVNKAGDTTKQRGFIKTLEESPKPTDDVKLSLMDDIRSRYKPITNKETVAKANARVSKDIEAAHAYVMNSKVYTAEHVATAHRLIDEFQKQGNFERAVDVAERIAEQGTKSGQSIQAYSIYNRLSVEGILIHAQRIAAKANEKLPVGAEPVKVTKEMAAELTDLAATVQKMSGTKQAANDVIGILERAKAGEKLSEAETKMIKDFVRDAKQFVDKDKPVRTPRPPKPIADKRIRDNVVSFLNAQEQAARERIAKATGRVSSTPVDIYADYAIIGASKMAKGVVKFADWSEQMVKEFGDSIKPKLEEIYNRAVEHLNLSTKKVSKKTISEAERITERLIKNGKIAEADAAELREMAQKVTALSGDAKIIASQDLQYVLKGLEKATLGQKISMLQIIAQLLNPKTLNRNALGNEIFYRIERLNKYISTPIDWARVKLSGGQRQVTFATNNQGEYWKNWLKGFQAGWKGVNPEGLTTQYDLHPNIFTHKLNPLTYLEKVLGASLKSFDYAAYKRAANETVGELATLDAINRGLTGQAKKAHIERFIRNADENILSIADEYGRYVTFQDNNVISVGLTKFKRGLNLGKDFGFGDIILKYPKTPGALLMRAIEYSPAGFLRSAYIFTRPLLTKAEPNTREVMLSLSRAITGSFGLTGMGYFLADAGILTGKQSKDKDIRELQNMSGQGQYKVNITALTRWAKSGFDRNQAKPKEGDTLVSYDWAQPVAVAIAAGVNANKAKKEGVKGAIPLSIKAAESGANTIFEQSVLEGVKRAFETRPGETGVVDKLKQIASDAPASFMPTMLNQMRQYLDNTRRLTYSEDRVQESMNKAKNRIPFFAQGLPVGYDILGNQKQVYQDNSNNLFNVFLNPAFVSTLKLSPEAKLVTQLISRTGNEQLAPRSPNKAITVDGKSIRLTPEEYSQLQKLVGEETTKQLRRINPNLNDKAMTRKIEEALDTAGERARRVLKKELKQKGRV